MHLVAGQGQQVAANFLHIEWHLARSLHRVGVEVNIGFRCNPRDLAHRLQDTGFVVRQDYADELGLRTQRPAHIVRIDQRAAIHR